MQAEAHTDALDVQRAGMRERFPGAEINYVRHFDGHVEWSLRVRADSPEHLDEEVRQLAEDGGWLRPVIVPERALVASSKVLPFWAEQMERAYPDYQFTSQRVRDGRAIAAVRAGDGPGPLVVITDDEDEMRAALGRSLA